MAFKEKKEGFLFKVKTSKMVRLLLYPYMNYKRAALRKEYAETQDAEYIRSLKGTKAGKRCFIIGNGPSLTADDLNKLKEEDTFAFNRIFYMFEKTDWRPTYYMCVDSGVLSLNMSEIEQLKLDNIILSYIAKNMIDMSKVNRERIHFLYDYSRFKVNRFAFDKPYISEDVSEHFCFCFTVTFDAIQLAMYMGYSEIYLIGVDHNYSVKADSKGRIIKDNSVKDYFEGLEKTSITLMNYEATTAAFRAAREYADKHGVKVYNATRGGKLEEFERVELDSLFV